MKTMLLLENKVIKILGPCDENLREEDFFLSCARFYSLTMVLVYCEQKTSRLEYIFRLIFTELMRVDVEFTTQSDVYHTYADVRLWYAKQPPEHGCHIAPAGLLTTRGIHEIQPKTVDYGGITCLFPVDEADLPYDPFSSAFYLVTRYEEYLPFRADSHGRFPASESFASKHNFLHIPVVNHYALHLKALLQKKWDTFRTPEIPYRFMLTFDVDAAWAYRNKGFFRTLGGLGNALLQNQLSEFAHRIRVLAGKDHDPFDTFNQIFTYQRRYKLDMTCFILLGDYSRYDKNIPWHNITFQDLIKHIGDYAALGIHPSYESWAYPERVKEEISRLSAITRRNVLKSRQHFLRLSFPTTYRTLTNLGIKEDYTMGFAADFGFRAGICSPYYFYDLEQERITGLRIFPFAFMEGTLKDYLSLSPEQAIQVIENLIQEVKKVNGTFISLWHNESLSDTGRWVGWKRVCDAMIEKGRES
ncbi:MAG: polysaccharide deacetylase family protein [Bacteroidales bacterium]|nr:polysaccharide deacetylase family protein [Bacteroidales bacterium]MDY0284715.1 polysaccharide deacetylase family protein [Bacteroidales bacterium]HPE86939.1 polysaccharide deacetylase family protein [Bacteroidales bacterium]